MNKVQGGKGEERRGGGMRGGEGYYTVGVKVSGKVRVVIMQNEE